jgi:flagellar biosynthetic protein FlhB
MPDSPAGERTEEATAKRRLEARRKGTVAKSHDLTSAAVIVALLLVLPGVLGNLGTALMRSMQVGISDAPRDIHWSAITSNGWNVLQGPFYAILPLMLVALAVGLGMNFAQVGFVASAQSMTPNFQKLNPLNGVKRLFSPVAGVEGLKAVLKTSLFTYLAWTTIRSNWNDILSLGWGRPATMFGVVGNVMHQIFLRVAISWLALAALDYYFQRKQVDKQLRMTKQEVKQEMREMELAPELKGFIARRRRAISKARMMEAVKKADVIVTNPTHYSVAIQYDSKKMHAPRVVAKGQDLIALKIREVAAESKVPVVPNPPLARQLYKRCEIGDFVPRELFQAVAEVLAYVYRTMRRTRVSS